MPPVRRPCASDCGESAQLPCGPLYRRTRGEPQAGQKKLAVLGVAQEAGVRYHDRGNGAQLFDGLSCVVDLSHMSIASSEPAIRLREAWIVLDREQQLRHRLGEAPADKMRIAYGYDRGADPGHAG